MLVWLVRAALTQRVLVLACAALLVVLGLRASGNVPLDVFPEFAPPMVEVQTEAPGLSTEEVESLITVPIETQVNGVPGLATLRSKSVLGLSSVQILFDRGTDVIRARQLVQERVAQVQARLPTAARPPVMLPPLSSTSRAMKIGISSKKLDQMQLSELARWTIRPRLMAVPGVANVAIWGLRDRQLQILVDPDRLRAAGVTLAEVRAAAGDAVLIGGGGFVDTAQQRLALQQTGAVQTAADLAAMIVKQSGEAPVRIGDVARVVDGFAAPIGNAIIDDGPGLMLIVEKQPTGNTLQLTHAVEAAIAELKPSLRDVKIDTTIFRPATFIERSIDNLTRALMIGCLLVAIVLFAFTRDWRQAVISLVAIPLSLLGAGLVLLWSGATINTMVIAGLVIALGEVVDDAIIDVENIARRLRLNREAGNPRSAFDVVLSAPLEVRSAVVFASLIVMLVFLPIFFLGGVAGTFFQPLAVAYVLAIGASLLVALVVTPALCLFLLPNAPLTDERDTRLVAGLKRRYAGVLPKLVSRPALAMGIVAGGLMLAGIGYASFKDQFLPDFRETDFLMHFVEKPGTSIEAMDRITIRASKELRSIPGVRNFGAHIGRAEAADEVVGPNFTELWISLDEKAPYDASVARIKAVIDGYPGLYRDVLTYLRERTRYVSRAYAEYVSGSAEKFYPLPDHVSFEEASLIDTFSVCLHAQHLSGLGINDKVAVIGAGPIGLGQMMLAKASGADVIICDKVASSLDLARELGADAVVDSGREDAVERVRAFTGGKGADIVFECAGGDAMPTTLPQATKMVRRAGKVVIVGGFDAGETSIPLEWQRLQMSEIQLILSASFAMHDIYREQGMVLDLIAKGRIDVKRMITHRFPLDRINEAFDTAQRKEETGAVFVAITI